MTNALAGIDPIQAITSWKPIIELASLVLAGIGAVLALRTYRENSKRERAKWAVQFFEKFYESDPYKQMRDTLDCLSNEPGIQTVVDEESAAFTDYLNFFEMVAFPAKSKQLSESDVLGLFRYYLHCLKRHAAIMVYLHNKKNDFEHLRDFLGYSVV